MEIATRERNKQKKKKKTDYGTFRKNLSNQDYPNLTSIRAASNFAQIQGNGFHTLE